MHTADADTTRQLSSWVASASAVCVGNYFILLWLAWSRHSSVGLNEAKFVSAAWAIVSKAPFLTNTSNDNQVTSPKIASWVANPVAIVGLEWRSARLTMWSVQRATSRSSLCVCSAQSHDCYSLSFLRNCTSESRDASIEHYYEADNRQDKGCDGQRRRRLQVTLGPTCRVVSLACKAGICYCIRLKFRVLPT